MRSTRRWRGWVVFWAALALIGQAAAPATAQVAIGDITPRLKPAAPGPLYVSRADLERLNEVKKAVENRQFSLARNLANGVDEPIARSLAQWFYFYGEDPQIDIRSADAFLDEHASWPATSRLQMHVERRLTNATPAADILAFFDTRDPTSGQGKLQLARALFSAGERAAGEIQLRDAWVNHNFPLADEQRVIAQHAGVFTVEDHIARVDRLLWSREVTAARRVIPRLPARERRMAEARAALLSGAANGPALFVALKEDESRDSGVLHAAVRYYRRAQEEPRAASLARLAPEEPETLRNPARWWEERQLLMRWALTERRYDDAYAMAAGHGLYEGAEFAEAEFNAGWIALRFLNAPDRAETHFAALAGSVTAPISVSRAYYWLARAAEARGSDAVAAQRYARAAQHIYTYYGQLAAEEIGGAALARPFAKATIPTAEEQARFSSRPNVAALRILSDLDAPQPFLVFAYHVDDELESPGEYVELKRLADRVGATHVAVRAGKVGVGRGSFAPEVTYPLIFVPDEAARFAPPEIILGLSRQESEFNPRAFSSAGARGLMQLIPSTAEITARKEGLRYNRAALLDDPVYNMIIGSAHLSHLFERYNGSLVMTFAAYNAGASRVTQWVERYGDPRAEGVDPVDWVEQIPFSETRNYVQRVLENTQIYRSRLSEGPIAGRLAADLERGGARERAGRLAARGDGGGLPPAPARTVRLAALADVDAVTDVSDAVRVKPAPPPGASQPLPAAPDLAPSPALDAAPAAEETAAADTPAPDADIFASGQPAPAQEAHTQDLEDAAVTGTSGEEAVTLLETEGEAEMLAQECQTYREFLASASIEAEEELSADDLNAGMRAELRGDGPSC